MFKTEKILVRASNWIGDAVMTLPALKALHLNFPQSRLSVLSRPWVSDIYRGQAGIEEIITFDPAQGLQGRFKLIKKLRQRKFDLALLFPNSFDAAIMAFLGGANNILGYARDGRKFLLSHPINIQQADLCIHESFYYLNILQRAGLQAPFSLPIISPQPEALKRARQIIGDDHKFLLAIAPGAAFGGAKQWPVQNFAEAAMMILDKYPGRVMILGADSEATTAAQLSGTLLKNGLKADNILNLAGQSDLAGATALLSLSSFLLCNDSGLMHLAGALNVPLAAAFGPTNPLTTAPLGLSRIVRSSAPCSPCLKRECPLDRKICFDDVKPEKMAYAALELLRQQDSEDEGLAAVFLDRDGTINQEVDYLSRPEDMRLIPGAAKAIAALKRAGLKVVVTTNQSGVARGKFSLEDLAMIHQRMNELLLKEGGCVPDAIYFCPHHEDGSVPELAIKCDCRKPGSAMFTKAADELGINLGKSFWIGDRKRDIEAASSFGGLSVLVCTGYGLEEVENKDYFQPSLVAPDLWRAAEWVCARLKNKKNSHGPA